MKIIQNTFLLLVSLAVTSLVMADNDSRKSFEICVNAATDFSLSDTDFSGTPTAGDIATAVGGIWPRGTIPEGGAAGDCSDLAAEDRIGTFFTNAHFLNPLFPEAQEGGSFPTAAEDDLAFVVWHFRIDGKGTLDTAGIIKAVETGGSYPQTITGGTGRFKSEKGEAKITVLGGGGFQFRVRVK